MNRPHARSWRSALVGATLAALAITGCSAAAESSTPTAGSSQVATTNTSAITTLDQVRSANADQTVVKTDEWDESAAVEVKLSGTGLAATVDGVTSADGVVTITQAGVYRLSGSLTGRIDVKAAEDAQVVLILDGVQLTATDQAALTITSADDVALHLADGSTNTVTSSGSYAEDAEANAAIWADTDLTISGEGALTVTGSAEDAITSKDDLVILSGTITAKAADDGIKGKDSLTIRGGTVTVDAGGDGLASDQEDDATQGYVDISGGTVTIKAGSDGIDGYTDVLISDGTVTITADEGIEAGIVAISGGTLKLTTTDDGINGSAGSPSTEEDTQQQGPGGGGGGMQDTGELVLITGGTLTIDAEGDGLDSNGSMLITGGTIQVDGPTRGGNGALDTNGSFQVTGGELVAFDAGSMTETPGTDSDQSWLVAQASGQAGAKVVIATQNGTEIASYTAAKSFAAVVYSGPELKAGDEYTVTVDGGTAVTVTAGEGGSGGQPGGQQGGGQPGGGRNR